MRRDLSNRLEKLRFQQSRPYSEMSDAELHGLIRHSIDLDGGTAASAAKHRTAGDERQARFVELYMADDEACWNCLDRGAA